MVFHIIPVVECEHKFIRFRWGQMASIFDADNHSPSDNVSILESLNAPLQPVSRRSAIRIGECEQLTDRNRGAGVAGLPGPLIWSGDYSGDPLTHVPDRFKAASRIVIGDNDFVLGWRHRLCFQAFQTLAQILKIVVMWNNE
jgi:hypothetical protein